MVIPKGAILESKQDSDKKKQEKSKKKSSNQFDELLGDLEEYEDGCENRSLMDST